MKFSSIRAFNPECKLKSCEEFEIQNIRKIISTMRNLCVYFLAFFIMQQAFISVVDAKMHPGFTITQCCNVEDTPATIKRMETGKKFMDECDQELGKYIGAQLSYNCSKYVELESCTALE